LFWVPALDPPAPPEFVLPLLEDQPAPAAPGPPSRAFQVLAPTTPSTESRWLA
jgi:hypothetical protein